MDDASASLSVAVLNFNGGQMVLDCLESVLEQTPPVREILCVDNDSSDGSTEAIEERFDTVKVVRLALNTGFAGGMNVAIDQTSGDFVALLNLDITLRPGYLEECRKALQADPRLGGVTGKLLRPGTADPPVIDTTGHLVYQNRRAVDRGELEPDTGQYNLDLDLFSICGAAPCYRRAMLDDVAVDGQYFDEDFFAYFEDFDLSWRAQLRGWRFGYVPQAVAVHHRGGSGGRGSTKILACNHRNRLLTMLRNDHPASFRRHLGGIAYTELRASLHMLKLRPAALLRAWGEFLRLVPRQMAKRRVIQSRRTVSWKELETAMLPYDYGVRATIARARSRRRHR